MNNSIVLLSTMSPKTDSKKKSSGNKKVSKLSLRKYFRRSLNLNELPIKSVTDNVLLVDGEATESASTGSDGLSKSRVSEGIVVLDSADVRKTFENKVINLSPSRFQAVSKWVEKVNLEQFVDHAAYDNSLFSNVSVVCGEKQCNQNEAANSTFVVGDKCLRFDELFSEMNKLKEPDIKQEENSVVLIEKKQSPKVHDDGVCESEHEKLLDHLYGDSWRINRDKVLPRTEPKKKNDQVMHRVSRTEKIRRKVSLTHKNPYLDSEISKSKDLLRDLHASRLKSSLESPLIQGLRRLADSDSDTDSEQQIFKGTRLVFDVTDKDKENLDIKKQDGTTHVETTETTCSFLASLSQRVPAAVCDPSARLFRDHYKTYKAQLVRKLFNLYNEKIFDNVLSENTPIEWSDKLRGTAGMCHCKKTTRHTGGIERSVLIKLSTKVLDSAERLRDTLIHEMCHAAAYLVNGVSEGHGPHWKFWTAKASETFPELPPIKICHNYQIQTKYTYKCVDCGYCVGRHSKSLDVNRKRCGHCYGKFELLVNKTTKSGVRSVPVEQKQITGFALFVKQNYAELKTPERNHKDVMQLLSKKFSDLKTQ